MASDTQTAGTGANDASAGSAAWSSTSNITADDGSPADASTFGFGGDTQYLKATNFGFSIPAGATIDGVVATWEARVDSGSTTIIEAKLVKGGTISGTDQSSSESVTSSWTMINIGSSSNLWGTTLSVSDVNNSGFGCVFRTADVPFAATGHLVDVVKMTVYYTTSSGASAGTTRIVMPF